MLLTGNTLGKRQQELNSKVSEAVANKVSFDAIKEETEKSDIDKLFKIDVASKYKELNYLIEILKSGDSLHISRVLKCLWIYEDEYSNSFNPDYLHHNIFPHMSIKMKKKLLTAISMNVRNESRAANFYQYCKNIGYQHFALKFLILTSVDFKTDVMKNDSEKIQQFLEKEDNAENYVEKFVGNNFSLVELCWEKFKIFFPLNYLYTVNPEIYLDMLEKYSNKKPFYNWNRFGLRMSKDIMKKHKNRVLNNICTYIKFLNRQMLAKHSTGNDVKMYLRGLLPNKVEQFWDGQFYRSYEYIINKLPSEEKYTFLKTIFHEKYPGSEFEMTYKFYHQGYYNLMTVEQKDVWALQQLENFKGGVPYDFAGRVERSCLWKRPNTSTFEIENVWYKFINFAQSFQVISKLIFKTPDAGNRETLLNYLTESAKNQQELEKLLKYFYDRHINENKNMKLAFLVKVMEHHNVFEFYESCWESFDKILYSLSVYSDLNDSRLREFLRVSLTYHIVNKLPLCESLKEIIEKFSRYDMEQTVKYDLSDEKKEILYQYILSWCKDQLNLYDSTLQELYSEETKTSVEKKITTKREIKNHVKFIETLLKKMKKEIELPAIVKKYKEDPEYSDMVKRNENIKITQNHMLRLLKQDAALALHNLPALKKSLDNDSYFRLNILLKKLRVYFMNDLATSFLKFFEDIAQDKKIGYLGTNAAVYGIFQLADFDYKSQFMMKYAPTGGKINHNEIDQNLLKIQEGICKFACYSRPPVPLSKMLMYVRQDYVHYCLPMFNKYMAMLPPKLCLELTESLLDLPVSIQKHGLRLAFRCFKNEDLKNLIWKVWKKTKNISLRHVIYCYLFKALTQSEEATEKAELFQILLALTLEINVEDHEEVIQLMTQYHKIPETFRGTYITAAWKSVSKFPEKDKTIEWKRQMLRNIEANLVTIEKRAVQEIIDEYLQTIFKKEPIKVTVKKNSGVNLDNISEEHFRILLKFIMTYVDKDMEAVTELVQSILKKCFEKWNDVETDETQLEYYYYQAFFNKFADGLIDEITSDFSAKFNPLLEQIEDEVQKTLSFYETFELLWSLRLVKITNTISENGKTKADLLLEKEFTKELVKQHAKQVNELLQELVVKKIFFPSLLNSFVNRLQYLLSKLNDFCKLKSKKSDDNNSSYNDKDIYIMEAAELIKCASSEISLLAAGILPAIPPNDSLEEYRSVVNKLKDINNFEVQALMYQKLKNSDFKSPFNCKN